MTTSNDITEIRISVTYTNVDAISISYASSLPLRVPIVGETIVVIDGSNRVEGRVQEVFSESNIKQVGAQIILYQSFFVRLA